MEITLKEGEQIKIRAEKGTPETYMVAVCIQNCILKKQEAEAIKPKKACPHQNLIDNPEDNECNECGGLRF